MKRKTTKQLMDEAASSNIRSLPIEVVDACRQRGFSDQEIGCLMSNEELFNEYCTWEGLINYGPTLWRIVTQLQAVKKK